LLANVAAFGHETGTSAAAAYQAGFAKIGERAGNAPSFEPPASARDLARLDAALAKLADLKPGAKRRVLDAVLATIEHDGKLAAEEIELFRAVAASLDCPVPPAAALIRDAGGAAQIR
jgi:hypothetical protein